MPENRPRRLASALLAVVGMLSSLLGVGLVVDVPTAGAFSTITGPDVSSWNHAVPIDWAQVRSSGQSFAFIKATQGAGASGYVNPYFKDDFAGAGAAALYRGAYDFAIPALPLSTAADQANFFADAVGPIHGSRDLPPVIDLEQSGGLDATQLAAWLQVWINTAQTRFGRVPMIYSGPGFWSSYMASTTAFTSYPLWQAQYNSRATPDAMGGWDAATFWQFTDSAIVPGIAGGVDLSRFQGTAADLVALAASRPPTSPYPDGTVLVSRQDGAVYRTAGGAPIYVSTFAGIPAGLPMQWVDQAVIDSLPKVPADGTVLVGTQRGEWYIVAGGAPIYTSTLAPIPAGRTATSVDQVAIDRAGTSTYFNHLRSRPADGTVIIGKQRGEWYIVAGGAPVYTSTLAPIPAGSGATFVDQVAIDAAGWPSTHLDARPADGSVLYAQQRGAVYIVAGGAPLYTTTFAPIAPGRTVTAVDATAIDAAGTGTRFNHLNARPTEGSVLVGAQRNEIYIVAGGAPIYSTTIGVIPPGRKAIRVDQLALDQAGSGLWTGHLDARPANGTVLIGAQRGEWYVVTGGAPVYTSTFAVIPANAHPVTVDIKALDLAGSSVAWGHLSMYPASGALVWGTPGQTVYQVNAYGQARAYAPAAAVAPGLATLIDQTAIIRAGQASPWNHLVR